MKKDYTSPTIEKVEIDLTDNIMGRGSIQICNGSVDPGQSWSNRHRVTNEWENIWTK